MLHIIKQYKILFTSLLTNKLDIPEANRLNDAKEAATEINEKEFPLLDNLDKSTLDSLGTATKSTISNINNGEVLTNNDKMTPLKLNTKLNNIGFPELYNKLVNLTKYIKITGDTPGNNEVKIQGTTVIKNGRVIQSQLNKFIN